MVSISDLGPDQINQYFAHIQLPSEFQGRGLNLEFLSVIHTHHISRIPYENVALHYSKTPGISLNIAEIYDKFVVKGRGGYCMEHNIFLCHVLRFLGFQVYLTGARLHRDANSSAPGWSGWEHAVNIVTLSNKAQYLVDVGYGGDGPTIPVPLDAACMPMPNLGTQELRLLHGSAPGLSDGCGQDNLWTYQLQNGPDQPWRSGYSFYEIEFFPRDFEVINFYTSQSPAGVLTNRVLVIRFLREQGRICGKVVLNQNEVKKNIGEEERVKILRDYFGIDLTREEQDAIVGRKSALA
ncbi:DUF1279 super [Aspergillus nanangensis]|uniref:DUF1279 super n=1 Tax=Aspergillus nanangensis TaxID=2582783 RepID=A0AAD4GPK1_ASPNN|nr:DUF1279 super [Aspergillus nanangensis]